MQYLKQSTAAIVLVGPVLDADGNAVTTAVIGDFRLAKNGSVAAMSGNTISHSHNGCYLITLTTTNTDTLDRLSISMGNTAYGMTVFRYTVLTAAQFDALVTNGTITPAAIEAALVNEGDATALLQAIADKIAGDLTAGDLTALAIVSAIKADATLAQMIARIDVATSTRLATASYTTPPTAAAIADAVHDESLLDHQSSGTFGYVIGLLFTLLENVSGWRFTSKALEQAPSGSGDSVIVAPLSATRPTKVRGSNIETYTGDTDPIRIAIWSGTSGTTPVDLESLRPLTLIIADKTSKAVIQTVEDTDLDVDTTNYLTFTPSALAVSEEAIHRWSLRKANGAVVGRGGFQVFWEPETETD